MTSRPAPPDNLAPRKKKRIARGTCTLDGAPWRALLCQRLAVRALGAQRKAGFPARQADRNVRPPFSAR